MALKYKVCLSVYGGEYWYAYYTFQLEHSFMTGMAYVIISLMTYLVLVIMAFTVTSIMTYTVIMVTPYNSNDNYDLYDHADYAE